MGLFGGNRKDQRAWAAELAKDADRYAAEAKKYKAEAARVRRDDKNSRYPDPAAVRAITRRLKEDQWVAEQNAKASRRAADEMQRLSKKWF